MTAISRSGALNHIHLADRPIDGNLYHKQVICSDWLEKTFARKQQICIHVIVFQVICLYKTERPSFVKIQLFFSTSNIFQHQAKSLIPYFVYCCGTALFWQCTLRRDRRNNEDGLESEIK